MFSGAGHGSQSTWLHQVRGHRKIGRRGAYKWIFLPRSQNISALRYCPGVLPGMEAFLQQPWLELLSLSSGRNFKSL